MSSQLLTALSNAVETTPSCALLLCLPSFWCWLVAPTFESTQSAAHQRGCSCQNPACVNARHGQLQQSLQCLVNEVGKLAGGAVAVLDAMDLQQLLQMAAQLLRLVLQASGSSSNRGSNTPGWMKKHVSPCTAPHNHDIPLGAGLPLTCACTAPRCQSSHNHEYL